MFQQIAEVAAYLKGKSPTYRRRLHRRAAARLASIDAYLNERIASCAAASAKVQS